MDCGAAERHLLVSRELGETRRVVGLFGVVVVLGTRRGGLATSYSSIDLLPLAESS